MNNNNAASIYISKSTHFKLSMATASFLSISQNNIISLFLDESNDDQLLIHSFHAVGESIHLNWDIMGPTKIIVSCVAKHHSDEFQKCSVSLFGSLKYVNDHVSEKLEKAQNDMKMIMYPWKVIGTEQIIDKEISSAEKDIKNNSDKENNKKCIQETKRNGGEVEKVGKNQEKNISTNRNDNDTIMAEQKRKRQRKGQKLPLGKNECPNLSFSTEQVESSNTKAQSIRNTTSLTKPRRLSKGIFIQDIIIGIGKVAKSGKKISITYQGSFLGSTKEYIPFDFQRNRKEPFIFRLGTGEVIRGLERGIEGMNVGGIRTIAIPPEMGYGKERVNVGHGKTYIPENSSLEFEVELIQVG